MTQNRPNEDAIVGDPSSHNPDNGGEVKTLSTARTGRSIFSGSFWSARSSMYWSAKSITTLEEAGRRRNLKESWHQRMIRENVLQQTKYADEPLDWSGSGQHIEVAPGIPVPSVKSRHVIAHTNRSLVEEVLCRRVRLVRKSTSVRRDRRASAEQKLQEVLSEVRQLSSLRHPHIVQLIGTYLQGDRFSMLLYPVADCDLASFLETCEGFRSVVPEIDLSGDVPLESPECRQHTRSLVDGTVCLLDALRYVHENCIRHLDIKPQNVLVKRNKNAEGNPSLSAAPYLFYLCDFGISKDFSDPNESKTEEPPGRTPTYCSPEVFAYEEYGRASDVFSLGCVLLEVWTVVLGRRLDSFIDFRSTFEDTSKSVEQWGDVEDISFQGNLAGVHAWIERLKIDPDIKYVSNFYGGRDAIASWYHSLAWQEPVPRFHADGKPNPNYQRRPVGLKTVRKMLNVDPLKRPTLTALVREAFDPWHCCIRINPTFEIEVTSSETN